MGGLERSRRLRIRRHSTPRRPGHLSGSSYVRNKGHARKSATSWAASSWATRRCFRMRPHPRGGCFTGLGSEPSSVSFTAPDVADLHSVGVQLNQTIAEKASAEGLTFVDNLPARVSHSMCPQGPSGHIKGIALDSMGAGSACEPGVAPVQPCGSNLPGIADVRRDQHGGVLTSRHRRGSDGISEPRRWRYPQADSFVLLLEETLPRLSPRVIL
jgi:hypothetical protein